MTKYTSILLLSLLAVFCSMAAPAQPLHPTHPESPGLRLQVSGVQLVGPIAGCMALVWELPEETPYDAWLQIEVLDVLDESGSACFSVRIPAFSDSYLLQDPAFARFQCLRLTLVATAGQPLGRPVILAINAP